MKELKFNFQYLLRRKELYLSIFILFFISLFQAYLCVKENIRMNYFQEQIRSGEYQFILYNAQIYLNILVVAAFPTALNLIFADVSWLDQKNKTINILHNRLNPKKNILARYILSVIISFTIAFSTFMFNYLLLRLIYGSGNDITWFQGLVISNYNEFILRYKKILCQINQF